MEDTVAEQVAEEIKQFRVAKRLHSKYEFKFHRTKKSYIKELLAIVARYDFAISAIYIDKSKTHDLLQLVDQPKLYNWAIKELLTQLPLQEARVRIDGRSNKGYMRYASTYLRKELNKNSHKVLNIRFEDSARNDLIQLADIVAGSVNRSLQKDKSDAKEYLGIIIKKVISIKEIKTY